MAKIENSKTEAGGGVPQKDLKPTVPAIGYVKQVNKGLAEEAGDQSRLETPAPKGGVIPTKQA